MQRALLAAVEDTWTDLRPELWLCVTTVDLGLGEHKESRRRAAHGLAAINLIELITAKVWVPSESAIQGAVRRPLLFARLPMGAASKVYAKELRTEHRQHQHAMWGSDNMGGADFKRHSQWIKWYEGPEYRGEDVYDLD